MIPRATCRLQLTGEFGFDDAARIVPYLAALGISHVYSSPFLAARPGSSHGYDTVDYGRLSDELGGERGFEGLISALHRHGMGLILDFVPNHMGVGGDENPRWADVLEWGETSPHADDFDIDWSPAERSLDGKVLLPFLGDHYGNALERGELVLGFADGCFGVQYFEHRFPIALRDYAPLLEAAAADSAAGLEEPAAGFAALAGLPAREARARVPGLRRTLVERARSPAARAALEALLAGFAGTPGLPRSFDALHALLERQFYRLAYWRVATQEINYRRFFDINDLAGLRIEDEALFASVHRLVFKLLAGDRLDGLRIDHIDGLYDPAGYCERLRSETDRLTRERARGNVYLLVEKILAPHESLHGWPVDGTTGYEFMNAVQGLFVASGAERALTRIWKRFTGAIDDFEPVAVGAKREVLASNLASELTVLAGMLKRIARRSRRSRDFTLADLRTVLTAIIAHLPVYRTYVTSAGIGDDDRRYLDWALVRARRDHPQLEGSVFRFVGRALRAELPAGGEEDYDPAEVLRFAMKSQQLSGAVAAKGVEDTAFYRYNRLVSLNEVGGDPARFGVSPAAFHHQNHERAAAHPNALLTTASHDHKRGEDTRLRISAISELDAEWRTQVFRWTRLNRSRRRELDGMPAPGRHDEYLFYQTLIGTWLGTADEAYVARLSAYLLKAAREAKRRTSWIAPNADYEDAVGEFVRGVLDPGRSRAFLAAFTPFADRVARIAAAHGLAQTLLKLTSPGVPDIYQGAEYWDLSLVDPDNRRSVDFAARDASLSVTDDWAMLAARWRTGEIKQRLTARTLRLRADDPDAFAGPYVPLATEGARADHVVAFARGGAADARTLVAVTVRLCAGLLRADDTPLLDGGAWGDTALVLPAALDRRTLTDALTGTLNTPRGGRLALRELLGGLPVALLVA